MFAILRAKDALERLIFRGERALGIIIEFRRVDAKVNDSFADGFIDLIKKAGIIVGKKGLGFENPGHIDGGEAEVVYKFL